MQPPTIGLVSFALRMQRRGFLGAVGELWKEHGDVFRVQLGGWTLLFAMHPDAVTHVNVKNKKNYDKLHSYDMLREYLLGQGLVVSTGELWQRQRRLLAPFFTPKGVQAYAELMLRDSEALADRWEGLARSGEPVEISQEMTVVTASIILKAMFSTQSVDEINEIKDAVETMIAYASQKMFGFQPPLWVPTRGNRRYLAARELAHGIVEGLIAQRKGADESTWPDDLLTRMMQIRDEQTGEPMSESLLRDESLTTFFAGHETTARTMTFAWYALGANPDVAAKLHQELDRVLGGRTPTVDDLRNLPYTLQVIKEVLRLYPAGPIYLRDALGDDEILGFEVPAGTSVVLSPYFTHRHPDFWPDPEVFDPDRWLPEQEAARHRHAYHPFATGPRICIGNNFSLLESHLLLAVLAQRFSPRLPDGYRAEFEMRGVLNLEGGLPMVIEARDVG